MNKQSQVFGRLLTRISLWLFALVLVTAKVETSAQCLAQALSTDLISESFVLQQNADPANGQSASLQKAGESATQCTNLRFGNYTYDAITSAQIYPQEFVTAWAHSFISFPLPSMSVVPTITQATLSLYIREWYPTGSHQMAFGAYLVTTPWNEQELTWENRPLVDVCFRATTVVSSTQGWYEWDITPFVQSWYDGTRPNYGVMLAAYPSPDTIGGWAVEAYGRNITSTLVPKLQVTYVRPPYLAYLPAIADNYLVAPDLVVQSISTTTGLQVVIKNQGNAAVTDEFWVDLYINPRAAPAAPNQVWWMLCDEGLAWGVTQTVAPGESLTLTLAQADPTQSRFSGSLPAGTVLYAQVDSAHAGTTYGGVLESHEITGGDYNNVYGPLTTPVGLSALTAPPGALGAPGLPPRP